MKWKEVFPNGCDVIYRHGHRAVVTGDCIYFYGGGNWKICKQFNGYNVKKNLTFLPQFTGKVCPGVASFGMVINDDRVIIFGGMGEFGLYTNDLFTLNISSWTWTKHNFPQQYLPEPRIGHSFTISDDNKIYLFGGLINADKRPDLHYTPKYMNDLYILHMTENDKFRWEKLPTAIDGPCGRESHSAIFHFDEKEDAKFLIVFGGMDGNRLGDLWFLDLKQLVWVQFEIFGIPPAPRSLHTATLVDSKMYIFGGWVDRQPLRSVLDPPIERFETSNSLSYLDLDELKWVNCEYNEDEIRPQRRAGHSAVAVKNRIYVWGGRSCLRNTGDSACTQDFWYLETEVPPKVSNISLIRATRTTLEIVWDEIDNAECYIVEIHKIQDLPIDLSKIRIMTNLPKVEHEKPVDQIKGTSVKRKFEELELTPRKKFITDEMKEELKLDDKLTDENQPEETKINEKQAEKIKTDENQPEETKINEKQAEETKINEKQEEKTKIDENKNIILEAKNYTKTKCESPIKSVEGIDKAWLTVGVYKSNSCIVDGFYTFKINTTNINFENCPEPKDLIPELKAHLTVGSMYAFRIAAVNLMGISEWSKLFYFKTADVEMPSMPNNCKFIPTPQGLRLAWNPNPLQEKITAYSVFIAINKNLEKNEFSFLRIYEGIQPTCHVQHNLINSAYNEKSGTDTYVIFRLTACNAIGTSSPLLTTYYL